MIELTPEFVEQYASSDSREQLRLSKEMTVGQKLAMGPMLFERECDIINRLIRETFPDATDQAVRSLLHQVVRWYHGED